MLTLIVVTLAVFGAIFDARALRPMGADAAALEERHRLRVIALKFYRTALAVYVGVLLGGWLLG